VARFLLICLGGAIGTGCRYQLSTWVAGAFGADFPRGTVIINVSGSFLIAVVLELSAITGAISQDARLFLTTGIMGGYTTYSSFNQETLRLVESGALGLACLNLAITVIGCLVAGFGGLLSARGLAHLAALLASTQG
jgi:fluoride exporter